MDKNFLKDFPILNRRMNGHPIAYLDNGATTDGRAVFRGHAPGTWQLCFRPSWDVDPASSAPAIGIC